MKVLKVFAIALAGLIVLLTIGFIFMNKKFTPRPNYLELTKSSNYVPIKWSKSKHSDRAGLYLPIRFKGIPQTFYLQFDTGAPSTMLYKRSMNAIQEKYPNLIAPIDSIAPTIAHTFCIGELEVYSKQFRLYDHEEKAIDWNDTTFIRIGTLGADIIDQKLTLLDFKNNRCYFGEEIPTLDQEIIFHDLEFKKRRVLIPSVVAGKKCKLLHDTGTSGFELITNEKSWKKLAKKGAEPKEAFKVKSWKKELTAFMIPSDKKIVFKASEINLNQVTYIEGASFMQHALMRLTGMGGMIGNQIFRNKILILDCKNKKYSIIE